MTIRIEQDGDDCLLWIKAVPGASQSQIKGAVGERLKVRVAAPPEQGKANAAICELLASALGIKRTDVTIEAGAASAEKKVRLRAVSVNEVHQRLCEYI